MSDAETLFCYVHPKRETFLRCNQCERPICVQCAVQTPTGYRCRECVRGQQKKFDTAGPLDYLLAPLAAALLSFLGSFFVQFLGFFTLILAPVIGGVIAEVVKRIIRGRRSKPLFYLIAAAVLAGTLPLLLASLLPLFAGVSYGSVNLYGLLPLIYRAAYVLLCIGTVYYRLSGIRL